MSTTAPMAATPTPKPRPGWFTAEALPAGLPTPGKLLDSKYPPPQYLGRNGYVGESGTSGVWNYDGKQSYVGKDLGRALATAQAEAKRVAAANEQWRKDHPGGGSRYWDGPTQAVFQSSKGAYYIANATSWTGNPEADYSHEQHIDIAPDRTDEFNFKPKSLVALVDEDAWAHRPEVVFAPAPKA